MPSARHARQNTCRLCQRMSTRRDFWAPLACFADGLMPKLSSPLIISEGMSCVFLLLPLVILQRLRFYFLQIPSTL